MTSIAPLTPNPSLQPSSCHCCQSAPSKNDRFVHALDMVCRVAVAAFALYMNAVYFAVSFGCGLLFGVAYALWSQQSGQANGKPVCATGFMEFLSGMRWPAAASMISTALFIVSHLRHDPLFFVPFCGFFSGVWAGRELYAIGHDIVQGYLKKNNTPVIDV